MHALAQLFMETDPAFLQSTWAQGQGQAHTFFFPQVSQVLLSYAYEELLTIRLINVYKVKYYL
jgi:hypothetical protein